MNTFYISVLGLALILTSACTPSPSKKSNKSGPLSTLMSSANQKKSSASGFNIPKANSLFPTPTQAPLSTNCNLSQALPIVTHWSNSAVQIQSGASDQIALYNPKLGEAMGNPAAIKYIYNYNFLPNINSYIGQNYSMMAIPDADAIAWAKDLCTATGQAFQFWKPNVFDGRQAINAIVLNAPKKSGVVLVVSGLTVSKSMFTIFLPANWTPPTTSQETYPIIFNGFYDINDDLFKMEGTPMGKLIARSVQNNGSGAIGLLWNGAGALASRTVNPEAWSEFQQVIDLVALLGGDPHRILAFGASRGGVTSLQMASNPNPHNYTFRYVDSGVPPSHIGTIGEVSSPTFPVLFSAVEWSSGLANSHKKSFVYPPVGNGLDGLNSMQTHMKILTGTTDPRFADDQLSLGSARFIQALKNSGTQVFLELGSHDFIVPSLDQLWLYLQYRNAGIPVELKYNYLAGHYTDNDARQVRLENQMKVYTHKLLGPHPVVNNNAISFFKVDGATGKLVSLNSNKFLFTLEVPRYLSPEVNGVIAATGVPNTEYEISVKFPDASVHAYPGTISSNGFGLLTFNPTDIPPGQYEIIQVRAKNPGDAAFRVISLATRSYRPQNGQGLVIENLAVHPEGTGSAITALILNSYLGAGREFANGIFTSVSYGIME